MLVSSYFNSVTAPILYHSFNIAGLAPTDFHTSSNLELCKTSKKRLTPIDEAASLSSSRLTRGRAHNPKLVQEVEFEHHRSRCCPWTEPTWLTDWEIPILRIMTDPRLDNDSTREPHVLYNKCRILSKLLPKKLICGGGIISRPGPDRVQCPSMETMVTILTDSTAGKEARWDLSVGLPNCCNKHKEEAEEDEEEVVGEKTRMWKQAIYILWTSQPGQSYFGFEEMDCIKREGIPTLVLEGARKIINRFAEQIARRIYYKQFPNEIVIVNMESLLMGWQPEGEGPLDSHKARREKWEELMERKLKGRYERVRNSSPFGDHGTRCKSVEEMENVSIKFITMEEYLANYDWTGEFTAEEIAPWLEVGSRKRKRSEENMEDERTRNEGESLGDEEEGTLDG